MEIKSLNIEDKHSDYVTYPYAVAHIMSAVYSLMQLPSEVKECELLCLVIDQSKKINKGVCLVMSESRAIFVELDGSININKKIPCGGLIFI